MSKAIIPIICLLTTLIIITAYQIEEIRIIITPKRHQPFIAYTPYWFLDEEENQKRANITWIRRDLDLVRELGFKGIKLFCIEGLEKHNLTRKLLKYCNKINLKVIMAFRIWRPEQFPKNVTVLREFSDFLRNLIPKIRDEEALYLYALHYPINYSDINGYAKTWFKNETYKLNLQQIINLIHQLDPNHNIYMALEFNPELNPPLNLKNIMGFGVEPYSWNTPETINLEKIIAFLKYFEDKGKHAIIDEYGLQTNRGYDEWIITHGEVNHGYCINEKMKAKILRYLILWIFNKPYIWCYFALHDTREADWGIAYPNNTLKESGKAIKSLLQKTTNP